MKRSDELHRMAEQHPVDPKIWLELALALLAEDARAEDRQAGAAIRAALLHAWILQPDDSLTCAQLGDALVQVGEESTALDAYSRATSVESPCLQGYVGHSRYLIEHGQARDAVALLIRSGLVHAGLPQIQQLLGQAYEALGDLQSALVHAQKAVSADPSHVESCVLMARLLAEFARTADSLKMWQHVAEISTESKHQVSYLRALWQAGEAETALAKAEQLHANLTNQPRALYQLGTFYLDAGRSLQAREILDQTCRLDPSLAEAFVARSHAHMALGAVAPALASLEQAIALRPTDASILRQKAKVLEHFRRVQEAVQVLILAISLAPNDESLRLELTRLMALEQNGGSGIQDEVIFSGNLRSLAFADALEFLRNQRMSGEFELKSEGKSAVFYLLEGTISACDASFGRSLASILLEMSLVEASVLEPFAKKHAHDPSWRLAASLRAKGAVLASGLTKAMSAKVKETMRELLAWKEGEMRLKKRDTLETAMIRLDIAGTLLDVIRQSDELQAGINRS